MPKYRSITISVVSQWEMKQFPEFPHPTRSQLKHSKSPLVEDRHHSISITDSSSLPACEADSDMYQVPSVTCYIPSIPDVRFFLKYTIEPPYPDGQLFYFKLFMNGQHISSWGVNPSIKPRGQVSHALFCMDENLSSIKCGRTFLRDSGILARPFIFTPQIDGGSAADDGGLIEVRVFRAKGRKRTTPKLDQFRPQAQYGINLPTAGLLDKPQDIRFYDWILIDRKDQPYATFLFHYRSWEHLQSLELIPPSHGRALLKPSNSAYLAITGKSEAPEFKEQMREEFGNAEADPSLLSEDFHRWDTTSPNSTNGRPLDRDFHGPHAVGPQKGSQISRTSTLDKRCGKLGAAATPVPVAQSVLNEWTYERPLPKLPKAKSSFDHLRKLSIGSNTPSVTPSLTSWLDRDSESASPEPIVAVASAVPVMHSSPSSDGSGVSDRRFPCAVPPNDETTYRPALWKLTKSLVPPPQAIFPVPTTTPLIPRLEVSSQSMMSGHQKFSERSIENFPYSHNRLSPSEGEWLRTRELEKRTEENSHFTENQTLGMEDWCTDRDITSSRAWDEPFNRLSVSERRASQVVHSKASRNIGNWI